MKRTQLNLEALDAREVPALLNLRAGVIDHVDSDKLAGQGKTAWFQQLGNDPTISSQTFLRMQDGRRAATADGVEEGFNTDARPLQLDAVGGVLGNHSIQLSSIPQVSLNGNTYREFLLTVRQPAGSPIIDLTELRLYVGNSGNLSGYDAGSHQLGGLNAVYDMDARNDNTVRIHANLNKSGSPDAVVLIPDSAFGSNPNSFVYLYSKFNAAAGTFANSRPESWSLRLPTTPPTTGTAQLSGNVQLSPDQANLQGVTVFLMNLDTGVTVQATTDANGNYSFTGLDAGNYQIYISPDQTITDPSNGFTIGIQNYLNNAGTVNGVTDGVDGTGLGENFTIDQINLADGAVGTSYNFLVQRSGG